MAGQQDNQGRQDKGASGPPPSTNGAKPDPTAVAQLVEQRIPNPQVAGSSPSRRDQSHHFAFGIFKYGQGYWVRMMTAVLAGVMFLSMAAWAWGELEKVHIPMPRWQLAVDQFTTGGELAPGQNVTLVKVSEGQTTTLGTGTVESYVKETKRATLMVNQLNLENDANTVDANRVEVPGSPAGAPPIFVAHVAQTRGIPLFPRVYLQAGIGAVIMLVGAWLIYWLVGVKPASVDFLIATDGEMKKVNWSTKKVIRDSTYVVIGYTFIIAGLLALADTLFFKLFQALGVLG